MDLQIDLKTGDIYEYADMHSYKYASHYDVCNQSVERL